MLKLHRLILIVVLTAAASASAAWPNYGHVRTSTLTYSASQAGAADFVARKYDIAINPSGSFLSTMQSAGTDVKSMRYLTMSSYRGDDYTLLETFCNAHGYDYDSMFMWVNSTVGVASIAPAGSPCDGPLYSSPGEQLQYCGWTSYRTTPDFRRPEVWEYVAYKYLSTIGDFDGAMEDEATFYYHPTWNYYSSMMCFPFHPDKWTQGAPSDVVGWGGMSHEEIRDSLMYLKQQHWLPALMDSLNNHDKLRFANPAAYGILGSDVIEDCILTGTGVLAGEGWYLRPTGSQWSSYAWQIMDTIVAARNGSVIMWTMIYASDSVALGSWARCFKERLVWYYMAADAEHCYFNLSGNEGWLPPNDFLAHDTAYKWSPVIEYDVGVPLRPREVAATGTDPAGQGYTLYSRDYTKSLMLYRGAAGSNYGSGSAITYNLGGTYRILDDDGTLSSFTVMSVDIRNAEGVILVPDDLPEDNVPPDPINDLGAVPGSEDGQMLLSWTATGDDGSTGRAYRYEFDWSLENDITAGTWNPNLVTYDCQTAGSAETQTLTGLQAGAPYYVAVMAVDDAGQPSGLSNIVESFAGGIMTPPALFTSTNENTGTATLSCEEILSYYDPITYQFELVDSATAETSLLDVSTVTDSRATAFFEDLSVDAVYFWRCRAMAIGTDTSSWTDTRRFRLGNISPNPPFAEYPQDSDTILTTGPGFALVVANGTDDDLTGPLTYEFELYSEGASNLLASASSVSEGNGTTSWAVPITLESNTDYSWRARCYDGIDYSYWMDLCNFTVLNWGASLPSASFVIIAYPNPVHFSQGDYITFRLPDEPVDLLIQTVSGETVLLVTGVSGDWLWYGENASGNRVAVGVYSWFVRGTDQSGKIVVKP